MAKRLIELLFQLPPDTPRQGRGRAARADGEDKLPAPDRGRHQEIAGSGIIRRIDPDAAGSRIGNNTSVDRRRASGEDQCCAIEMSRRVGFRAPFEREMHLVRWTRFQAHLAHVCAGSQRGSGLALADGSAADDNGKPTHHVEKEGKH